MATPATLKLLLIVPRHKLSGLSLIAQNGTMHYRVERDARRRLDTCLFTTPGTSFVPKKKNGGRAVAVMGRVNL